VLNVDPTDNPGGIARASCTPASIGVWHGSRRSAAISHDQPASTVEKLWRRPKVRSSAAVNTGICRSLHARITSMRDKGWIMLSDTEDARRKQLELTQAALRHFDKLSECLVKATKNT
jgi:hypothetical protein